MAEETIKAKYIRAHKELEKQYYKYGLISKEEFDQLHGQNWNDMRDKLITEGYLKPPEPVIDPLVKIAELEARIEQLEK